MMPLAPAVYALDALLQEATCGHRFLLEVGCEELPPGFLLSVEGEWEAALRKRLQDANIPFDALRIEKTPRRLVLALTGLPAQQADAVEELKGPPLKLAEADGVPTPVGEGFLRKNNATLGDIQRKTLGKDAYWVLERRIAGQDVQQLIAPLALEALMGLQGPRFMRWGSNQRSFPRPIRWIAAFWDDAPLQGVRLELSPEVIEAAPASRGHRTLGEATFAIASATGFERQLVEVGKVVLSTEARKQRIIAQLQQRAEALGGTPLLDAELLEQVAVILEYPSVIVGRFEESYLKLPKPVLVTVMKAHQKYFPVQDAAGNLLPYFLCVMNGHAAAEATIAAGNERVIKARFEDARFFFEEDTKAPLESYLPALAGVTFQKGLGSLLDKTHRLEALLPQLATATGLLPASDARLTRAAQLSKCDLATKMVFELTELQGEVGLHYALGQGEAADVAEALNEQYLPRFQGDVLPETSVGTLLSLGDKLDTWMAAFSQRNAKLPTGSKDPFALRRLVNGILLTVLKAKLQNEGGLKALAALAHANLGTLAQESFETTWALAERFALQRMDALVQELGLQKEGLPVVAAAQPLLADLPLAMARLAALPALQTHHAAALPALQEAQARVQKFLASSKEATDALPAWEAAKAVHPAEEALFAAVLALPDEAASDWEAVVPPFEALAAAVHAFFEGVLVNDSDVVIRHNRLALLLHLRHRFLATFGDLTLLD